MTPPEGPAGQETRPDALDEAVQRLGDVASSLQQLLDVQLERARVEFRDRSFRAAGWAFLVLFLLTLAVLSASLLARGLAQLMTGAFGGLPWAGNLSAAVLLLGLAGAIAFVVRARLRRRQLRRLRRKFEPEPTGPGGST